MALHVIKATLRSRVAAEIHRCMLPWVPASLGQLCCLSYLVLLVIPYYFNPILTCISIERT